MTSNVSTLPPLRSPYTSIQRIQQDVKLPAPRLKAIPETQGQSLLPLCPRSSW